MPLTSALEVLKQHAVDESSAVFVYDGFLAQAGSLPKPKSEIPIFNIETRSGSAGVLVGYLNALSSKSSADVKPVTVLATPSSVAEISNGLSTLSAKSARPPVVLHVAASEPSLVAGPDGPLLDAIPNIGKILAGLPDSANYDPVVIFSGGVDDGALDIVKSLSAANRLAKQDKDVVHAFDAISVGKEQSANLEVSSATDGAMDVDDNASGLEASVRSAVGDFFQSSIPENASTIVVLPSSLHSVKAFAVLQATSVLSTVGIITAKVLRPWSAEQLLKLLPTSTRQVYIYAEAAQPGSASLHQDVAYALRTSKAFRLVPAKALNLPSTEIWDANSWLNTLLKISGQTVDGSVQLNSLLPKTSKLAVFWSSDESRTSQLAEHVAAQFSTQNDVTCRLLTEYDNFSGKDLGIKRSILLLSPIKSSAPSIALSALVETSPPNLLLISGPSALLAAYDPFSKIDFNTQIIFSSSSWAPEEYSAKLSLPAKAALVASADIRKTWTLDVSKVVSDSGLPASDGLIEEAAFWHFFVGAELGEKEATATISKLLRTSPAGGEWSSDATNKLATKTRSALQNIMLPKEGEGQPPAAAEADTASPQAVAPLPTQFAANSLGPNPTKDFPDPQPAAGSVWHNSAKQLLFAEAYTTDIESTRPDLPEENFILEVTENRRLTPLDYDRNVFHMELSTKGTGLKYTVGEALGVHGHNDAEEVHKFIDWFGLDADAIVTVPARDHAHSSTEARTVFQTLHQNLDIFGKPGKAFYEALSKVSPEQEEERHLRFIASAEGSATFKKMSDVDTVTYVDVLKEFPKAAAKLGMEGLLREVPLIKPRHYSIASSQNFVGDSVHLLVVTVDWMTPKEELRFGQCTKYLAGLKIGDKVTVSVKPSVMKLPPKDTQPIIMAGLGTGAAPFRAFIQERQYQREQGIEIGPLLYYFGSRYSSKEFLYGEEIKAWLEDGLVTHAGLAFSRDTDKKVYIQHKMQEDGKLLEELLKDGYFYLCGPTWPVPDVYDALTKALKEHRGLGTEEAKAHLEELKEEERYILEVY